jgi:hypothetical protein
MNTCIENELNDIILKYQNSFSKTQSDMDICIKQIVSSLDIECINLGKIMLYLFDSMKIEIDKDIIYHLIFNLLLMNNIIYFYFSLPPFSICNKTKQSLFSNSVYYLSLVSLTSKISVNILNNLNQGLKKCKFKSAIETFFLDYISNSLNLIDDTCNNSDLEKLLTLNSNESERNKVLTNLFKKKIILFYPFIFQFFFLLTGERNNDLLDKYSNIGKYIGETIINRNTDLDILKKKIDLLNSEKSGDLFLFIKDKILKL